MEAVVADSATEEVVVLLKALSEELNVVVGWKSGSKRQHRRQKAIKAVVAKAVTAAVQAVTAKASPVNVEDGH